MIYMTMNAAQQGAVLYRALRLGAERAGYVVKKAANTGGAQIVNLERDGNTLRVAMRTTRNRWFAFVPLPGKIWKTLDDVEAVFVASVDNYDNPRNVEFYLLPAKAVRAGLDAAFDARTEAGHKIKLGGFGVWLNLDPEVAEPYKAGSGLALEHPSVAEIPIAELTGNRESEATKQEGQPPSANEPSVLATGAEAQQTATIASVLQRAREEIGRISGLGPDAVKLELTMQG